MRHCEERSDEAISRSTHAIANKSGCNSLAEAGLALCAHGEVFHLPDASHWVRHEGSGAVNRLLLVFLG
jgi:hypothetical protein